MRIKKKSLFAVSALVIFALAVSSNAALVAHYTFDTEYNGVTPDSVGNNEAVLGDRVNINTDAGEAKVGSGALQMLGSDTGSGPGSGAITSNMFAWNSSQAVTMTFWVKSTGSREDQGTFVSLGTNNAYGSRVDVKEGGSRALYVEFNGFEMNVPVVPDIEDGNWHFVAVVAPQGAFGSEAGLYVDGSNINLNAGCPDTSHPIATYTGPLVFGDSVIPVAVTQAVNRTPHAMIDDFQLYDVELTLAQINQLYTNPGFAFLPPTIESYDSWVTSLDLLPLTLSAIIPDSTDPIIDIAFALLVDDNDFPVGANAFVNNVTVDNQYPTAVFTTDMPGSYKVRLDIVSGTTTLMKVAEIVVYADSCQAMKEISSDWTANYFDLDGNCLVDIMDFAGFAVQWLDDSRLEIQENYQPFGIISAIPSSVFDARIEAESVDANMVSNLPLTDNVGLRIISDELATGGQQALGYANNGAFAEYVIEVPAAGIYDLYLSSAGHEVNAGKELNLGTSAEPTLYGSVNNLPTSNSWDIYHYTKYSGALSFNTAGFVSFRITWVNGPRNIDWFAILPHK